MLTKRSSTYIALSILAMFFALVVSDSQRVHAATGVIDALNVGTCLATSATVFEDERCLLFEDSDDWHIRDEVESVSTLYATYAHDPKSSWDAPRAITENSDLLKISIYDPGRDRRSGVLIKGEGHAVGNSHRLNILNMLRSDGLLDSDEDLLFQSPHILRVRDADDDVAIIPNSGSWTLLVQNTDGNYEPMDTTGNVRFYGCVTAASACSASTGGDNRLRELTRHDLDVDEDSISLLSNPSIAPWFNVNAGVPSGQSVLIYALYYETSSKESMAGSYSYHYCGAPGVSPVRESGGDWMCDSSPALTRSTDFDVEYTSREMSRNDDLLLRARSDGDTDWVNLHLEETSRFSGRYEGYVRLTDANGDGRYDDDDPVSTDWGAQVRDASGGQKSNAAVIGVANGPVRIDYRDSGGSQRTLQILVDFQPPRIDIEFPLDRTASDDHSPEFYGTFEDYDSGLAQDSFRLVVNNDPESLDYALDGIAPDARRVRGTGPMGSVTRRLEYIGYSTGGDDSFGVVDPGRLYDLGEENCRNRDQEICHLRADRYRDGDQKGEFDDSVRLDRPTDYPSSYGVDFQAYVMDIAGNIGFSDSKPNQPAFISDLGTENPRNRVVPNVLGYFSAHVIGYDDEEPYINNSQSATGYFGRDSDGMPIPDRSSLMLVFDGAIEPRSVSLDTFEVILNDGTEAEVVEVLVDVETVFLKLSEELASDATPRVSLASGETIEDLAGNAASGNRLGTLEPNDGISPKLEVSLSGGTGTGTDAEGPDQLTNGNMTIHISSDEPLQGTPRIVVVCENLTWEETVGTNIVQRDIDDFINNRSGYFLDRPGEPSGTTYTCGEDLDDDDVPDRFLFSEIASLSRPGENWEYEWRNLGSRNSRLSDGKLRVVAFARDRSRYFMDGRVVYSWSSTSAGFTLDTTFESPLEPRGGDVFPKEESKIDEARPFVLIEFDDRATVTLDSVLLDGEEVVEDFSNPDVNRFVYWPLSMARGEHKVEVTATDAAGNAVDFRFRFESTERGDFVLDLATGWNAISFPSTPIDSRIEEVFRDPAIESVIGWDTEGWSLAVRRDGVWTSHDQFAPLNRIQSRYGYWVRTTDFVRQGVKLQGVDYRSANAPALIAIDTKPGWNFVGVVDIDGDQIQDHFGVTLLDNESNTVTATAYLGDYIRAYTWNSTLARFEALSPTDTMTIGTGIWVYYAEGTGITP